MRITLVFPEVYDIARFKEKRKEFPPFGVLYLAAVLEEAGHEVRIERISAGDAARDFSDCDVVGFSVPSSATLGTVLECRTSSRFAPRPLLLAGGVHANLYPEQTFEYLEPDAVCVGEGERAILELVARIEDRDFGDVAGTVFRRAGTVVRTPDRKELLDISKLPFPARHLLPKEDIVMADRLSNTNLRMAHVMFSRGCPFPCRFCAVAQTAIQYRTGESARAELVHLKETYGIDGFAIVDDNFIVNRNKVHEICDAIQDLGLRWSALSRVDTVRPDLLEKMRDSGCLEIKYGMESGSERILRAMNKKIRREQIVGAVSETHRLGIKVKLFVIHGYPGENMESTRESIGLLRELAPMVERVSLFRFVPLPGTYVYKNPEEFGLHGTDRQAGWDGDWSKYHIHHNDRHWWGDERDFAELRASFEEISNFVEETWPGDAAVSRG